MALDRRGFLKFAIGGAVGTLFTPLPWKLADDVAIWTQNWPWIPRIPRGEVRKKYTLVKYSPYEYGAYVNIINGNAITLSGNKGHYLSRGGIEAVGLSSVGLLYSPARIRSPLLRKGNRFIPITWEEGKKILIKKLKEAKAHPDGVFFLSGDTTSSSNEIFSAITTMLGSSLYFFDPSDRLTYFKIWNTLLNGNGEVGFDLENSDHVLAVGCNILNSWGTPVRAQRLFGEDKWDITSISPFKDNTSAVAKKWICAGGNQLYKVVLGIINAVLSLKSTIASVEGMEELISFVRPFTPERISEETGVNAESIKDEAKRLVRAKSPLVIGGSTFNGGQDEATITACMVLNILLDRINQEGGIRCIPRPPKVIKQATDQHKILLRDIITFLKKKGTGTIKVGLFYQTNPFYSFPPESLSELRKIPYRISFSTFFDETARESHLILPCSHFLERMDDCYTPFGSGKANYSVANRAVGPIHKTKSIAEFFVSISKELGIEIGITSYKDLLKTKAEYLGVKLEKMLEGKVWEDPTVSPSYGIRVWKDGIQNLFEKNAGEREENTLELVPIALSKLGTPITGIPPLNLKVIYEYELNRMGFFVYLSPKTAADYHLKEGDRVEISSRGGKFRALVRIDSGVAENVICAPLGFGHKGWSEFNRNKGDNVANAFYISLNPATGNYTYNQLRVRLNKI